MLHYTLLVRQHCIDAALDAAELRLWAERRIGEFLDKNVKQGRPNGKRLHDETFLPEGVNKTQSHRWQKVASVPSKDFRDYLDRGRQAAIPFPIPAAAASWPSR